MSDIRIRKAKSADAELLLQLKREVSTILLTRLGHTLDQVAAWQDRFATPEYIKQHLRSPHALYVVEDGGEVRGMAGLTLKDDGDDSIAYFGNLYVNSSGHSYGSRLMEYRLGVVEAFNVDYIKCHVHAGNERARRFVEHYGFRASGSYNETRLGSENIIYLKLVD